MIRRSQASGWWLAAFLIVGLPVAGQVKVGDDVALNLSGNLGFGYSGSYGDLSSAHGISGVGNADLTGSYYSPQFLSFHLSPYLNESRESSNFDSVSSTSGFRASANIFSGSHFPGWVNYSRTYDSSSTLAVPGLGGLVTHGNSDSFGVGWSEIVPRFPSLSIGYQQGGGDFETFGAAAHSLSGSRALNASTAYRICGFNLTGNYHYGTSSTELPTSLFGNLPLSSDSTNDSYSVGVSHSLPLHGTAQAHFNSTWYDFTSQASNNSGSIDSLDSSLSLSPTSKLSLDGNLLYTDNLVGTLFQSVLGVGGIVVTSIPGHSSDSLGVSGDAIYSLTREMRIIGRVEHRQQTFAGNIYDSDSMGGVFSYFRALLGGRLTFVQSVSRNTLSVRNESQVGLSSSASYSRSLHAWNVGGSFIFNRNHATALVLYTTDSYAYSGTVGRPLKRLYWNLNAGGSKSSVSGVQGSDISTQNYATSLSMQRIGFSASYSRSTGNAIQTSSGLAPPPVPLPVLPSLLVLFGGESYSFGAGGSPVRGLSFTATFVKTKSNANDGTVNSRNDAELGNFYTQYRFRKVNFNAGYTRILQGFSLAQVREQTVNSYYFGISRWFNFF